MKSSTILVIILALLPLAPAACSTHKEAQRKVQVAIPQAKNVTLSRQYIGKIQAQHSINVCALEKGYLDAIPVEEGEQVKEGDLMFNLIPFLSHASVDAALAEVQLEQQEYDYFKKRYEAKVVPVKVIDQSLAKLKKAQAKVKQVQAELNRVAVKAAFDGMVGHLRHQQGSLVDEGELITTLSESSIMQVYFKIPEAHYLDSIGDLNQYKEELLVELILPDGEKFSQTGKIVEIESDGKVESRNLVCRADFPNPDGVLRHGQMGAVQISRVQKDAIVVPQRGIYEVQDKWYVCIIDKDGVAHQREVLLLNEIENLFVIKSGLNADDKIVLEGFRKLREGDKVDFEVFELERGVTPPKGIAE